MRGPRPAAPWTPSGTERGRVLGDPGARRRSAPELGGGRARRCAHGGVSRQRGRYRRASPTRALQTRHVSPVRSADTTCEPRALCGHVSPVCGGPSGPGPGRHDYLCVDSGPFGTTGVSRDTPVESVLGQSLADTRPPYGRTGLALAPGPRCVGAAVSPGSWRGWAGRRSREEVPACRIAPPAPCAQRASPSPHPAHIAHSITGVASTDWRV